MEFKNIITKVYIIAFFSLVTFIILTVNKQLDNISKTTTSEINSNFKSLLCEKRKILFFHSLSLSLCRSFNCNAYIYRLFSCG